MNRQTKNSLTFFLTMIVSKMWIQDLEFIIMSFSAYTRLFGGTCDMPPWLLWLICTVERLPSPHPAPSPCTHLVPKCQCWHAQWGTSRFRPCGTSRFFTYFVIFYHHCCSPVMDSSLFQWVPEQGSMPAEMRGTCTSPDLFQTPRPGCPNTTLIIHLVGTL